MTERDRIRFGDTTIEYDLRRSARRRKTVQISVDGGGVQVAAPMTTPAGELRAIVRKRAPWILSHASGELLEAAPKRFVSGETLPYLGRNVRMIFEPADVRSPRSGSTTGDFMSPCLRTSIPRDAMNQFGAQSQTGTKQGPPIGYPPAFAAGGHNWAGETNLGYSSAIKGNDGEVAPRMARCDSTGGQ